jgi:hypothetical protein
VHGRDEETLHTPSYRTYVLMSMREFVQGVHGVISLTVFGERAGKQCSVFGIQCSVISVQFAVCGDQ